MAARKMSITFGLMSLKCRRENAVEAPTVLRALCVGQGEAEHSPMPLRQDPSWCPTCGDVDRDTLVKGSGSGDTWTIVEADTLADAEEFKGSNGNALSLVPHPADEFLGRTDTGEKVYYVWPEEESADHYALLVQVIGSHPELAFAGLMALSANGTNSLWHVRVRDGVLLLEQRTREQSMKAAPEVAGTANEALLGMVEQTLSAFVVPYEAATYEDQYEKALRAAIDSGTTIEAGTSVAKGTDDDIMAKLSALAGK